MSRITASVLAIAAAAVLAAGCATGDDGGPASSPVATTGTVAGSTVPGAPSSAPASAPSSPAGYAAPSASETPANPTAAVPAGPVTDPQKAAAVLGALAEIDPKPFTEAGGSAVPGTHFTNSDRTLTCMFNTDIQQCYYTSARKPVFGPADQCPAQKEKVSPLQGDLVGWGRGLVPLTVEPVSCRLDGVFPYMFGESPELPVGKRITLTAGETKVQCGNRSDIVVCATADHGFAASAREYVSW